MIEVVLNDRLGKKVRVKCNEDDTIGDLKKLAAAQLGTRPEKLKIQKWYTVYKDHITLEDYEIHDGMGLELYYQWVEDYVGLDFQHITPRIDLYAVSWLFCSSGARIIKGADPLFMRVPFFNPLVLCIMCLHLQLQLSTEDPQACILPTKVLEVKVDSTEAIWTAGTDVITNRKKHRSSVGEQTHEEDIRMLLS